MQQGPGEHRLAEVEAPPAVGGDGRVERPEQAVVVEPHPPLGEHAVPLAGHRQVLAAGEPQPHRPPREPGAQRRDGRVAVRLHLLAAEAAPHPQALHGHLVGGHAEHVRHDVLGLGGVLGAALHEHLPVLVDLGQGALGLEVEVLLPADLELAAEDVRRAGQGVVDVPALDGGPAALEAARRDGLAQPDDRRQRLVVDLNGQRPEPRRLEARAQHPADGVPAEHHLGGEQRLVVPGAGVVQPRHVVGGEHAHHPWHRQGGVRAQPGDPCVRVRCLHRMGVQHAGGARHEVIGVERLTRDVQGGRLVRTWLSHNGFDGWMIEHGHDHTSSGRVVRACSRVRAVPSMADR